MKADQLPGHQFFLSFTPLQNFVISQVRNGLIGANKEGLSSLPGYLAIYLLGLATGEHLLRAVSLSRTNKIPGKIAAEQAEEKYQKRRTKLALELVGYSVAWWTVLAACRLGGMGVSRRLVSYPRTPFFQPMKGVYDCVFPFRTWYHNLTYTHHRQTSHTSFGSQLSTLPSSWVTKWSKPW